MDNVYGFTTNTEDNYFPRVVAEASADTNFLVVSERNTVTGERNAVVLVRKEVLASSHALLGETIAGSTVAEWLAEVIMESDEDAQNPWKEAYFRGDDVDGALVALRHELRRIDNVIKNRVVRVEVESF